jgi:hypothetical protein
MLKAALSLFFDFVLLLMDDDTRPSRNNIWASVIAGVAIVVLKLLRRDFEGGWRAVFVEALFPVSVVTLILLTPDVVRTARKLIAQLDAQSTATVTLSVVDLHGNAVVKPASLPPARLARYYVVSVATGTVICLVGIVGFTLWLGIDSESQPSNVTSASAQSSPSPTPSPLPSPTATPSPTPTPTIRRSRKPDAQGLRDLDYRDP